MQDWKSQEDLEAYDIKRTFSLESLPVSLSSRSDLSSIKEEVEKLANKLWDYGGHRFTLNAFYQKQLGDISFWYGCCQDLRTEPAKVINPKRDVKHMCRYECQSSLTFRVCLRDQTYEIALKHLHHTAYKDIALTPEAVAFIDGHTSSKPPPEIFRSVTVANVDGAEKATQNQVYYRWRKANEKLR
ncbi:hypothetical protein SEPCBS57363_002578 [Sporothrix epigloea]|uniref:Uncharacterized protein n=1 Tax=Sporothrix epigloea TaxID=1892477 RepID=A0ABP0DGP3_9PEZI